MQAAAVQNEADRSLQVYHDLYYKKAVGDRHPMFGTVVPVEQLRRRGAAAAFEASAMQLTDKLEAPAPQAGTAGLPAAAPPAAFQLDKTLEDFMFKARKSLPKTPAQ